LAEQYFRSDKFATKIEKYSGDSVKERRVSMFAFTRAFSQSSCIPHIDSVSSVGRELDTSINLIFFISGTSGQKQEEHVYGHLDGPIEFESHNLVNTCLIYRSEGICHGFPPMRFGAYRWMFTAHALCAN